MTPDSAESPIVHPPMKWAVNGLLNGSPMVPPAVPPTIRAIRRAASLAAGIQVGLGSPLPWREVSTRRPVSRDRFVYVVIELSRVCMTSAITVFPDQLRTSYSLRTVPGFLHSSLSQVRHRGSSPCSSVSTVCRRLIELLPLP